jgi:hypothetical protein
MATFTRHQKWGSSVGIATGYRLDSRGMIPSMVKGFLSSPLHADQLWGTPSLVTIRHHGALHLEIK